MLPVILVAVGAYLIGDSVLEDTKKYAKGGKTQEEFGEVFEDNVITEKEINLIKTRLNNGREDQRTEDVVQYIWDNSPKLTGDQNEKGIKFLRNLWKSPTGKERSSNPFGYREQEALETFEYFELAGFHDISRYGQSKFYVPLYNVIGNDVSFQYYYDGKVNIVGKDGMEVAKKGKLKMPEWAVTITSEDGESYDWDGFAKDEDDALFKAEKEAGFESVESGVTMITDASGKKIEYKKGGKLVGKQKNLDVNKNGKLDAEDFKILRGEKMEDGGKLYDEMYGVGKSKYVVKTHDGVKKHPDGSPFYDITIFKNKIKKNKYISDLKEKGYKKRTF
jgi:hypothetical protein